MTSTPVTEKSTFFPSITNNVNVKETNKDAFKDCFSQVRSQENQTLPKEEEYKEDVKPLKPETDQSKTEQPAKEKPVKAEEKPVKADVKEQNDAITEAAEEAVEAVAAALGIPVEQVMQMMQEMELTPMDLLTGEKLGDLVAALCGEGNQADLLTNENLFQTVKELKQTLEGIKEEVQTALGMDDGEFQATLEKLQTDVTENAVPKEELPKEELPKETAARQPVVEVVVEAGETNPVKTAEAENGKTETTVQNETPAEETGLAQQSTEETAAQNNGNENGSKQENKKGENLMQQQTAAGMDKTNRTIPFESIQDSFHATPETENIMKQIMDYMKIQVKADLTKMEIQLHPASLGNINVQITSKSGAVTAQFTAQNETVKAALEAQVVQLRETLSEQGVKVEAVEVTIASHEFERNLNQNSSQSGNGESEEKAKKGIKRMNLNLNGMDTEEELMLDEADKLTADIMARNGNTVDFSA